MATPVSLGPVRAVPRSRPGDTTLHVVTGAGIPAQASGPCDGRRAGGGREGERVRDAHDPHAAGVLHAARRRRGCISKRQRAAVCERGDGVLSPEAGFVDADEDECAAEEPGALGFGDLVGEETNPAYSPASRRRPRASCSEMGSPSKDHSCLPGAHTPSKSQPRSKQRTFTLPRSAATPNCSPAFLSNSSAFMPTSTATRNFKNTLHRLVQLGAVLECGGVFSLHLVGPQALTPSELGSSGSAEAACSISSEAAVSRGFGGPCRYLGTAGETEFGEDPLDVAPRPSAGESPNRQRSPCWSALRRPGRRPPVPCGSAATAPPACPGEAGQPTSPPVHRRLRP